MMSINVFCNYCENLLYMRLEHNTFASDEVAARLDAQSIICRAVSIFKINCCSNQVKLIKICPSEFL